MTPHIFLIPGLDGSGILFHPFLEVFPLPVTVLPYHTHTAQRLAQREEQDIAALTDYLTQQILHQAGEHPVIVIAESFGGVMTDRILQEGKVNVVKAIFLAGFLRRPSYWSALGRLTQPTKLSISAINIVPEKLLSVGLFWHFGTQALTDLFRASLNRDVYVEHIGLIATLVPCENRKQVRTPTLYLQASHDSLVNKRCLTDFKTQYGTLTVKKINASHFLVESNPVDASQAIVEFINQRV